MCKLVAKNHSVRDTANAKPELWVMRREDIYFLGTAYVDGQGIADISSEATFDLRGDSMPALYEEGLRRLRECFDKGALEVVDPCEVVP